MTGYFPTPEFSTHGKAGESVKLSKREQALMDENTRLRADLRRMQEAVVKCAETGDDQSKFCVFCGARDRGFDRSIDEFKANNGCGNDDNHVIDHRPECIFLTCQAALGSKHE